MRRSVVLASLVISASASAGVISQPILGGTRATVDQFPTVVSLDLGGALCTGTLIDKDWVLTAAHCLEGVSNTGVTVRFHSVSAFSGGTTVKSAMVFPKPTFSINALGTNDIGLIKLASSVTDITPVPVNLVAAKAPVGIMVTMVGFGATAQGGGGNIGIEYVVDQQSIMCTPQMGLDVNLLCYNQVSGKGKCQGDSGGPSFSMIDGRMVQVGITSFGDQNCAQFGADTRTDAERDFLLQHIPQLECSMDSDCAMGKMCFMKHCIAQPFSPTGLGTACTMNTECDSGTCAMTDKEGYCSMACTFGDNTTCPDGLECLQAGAGGTCWPIKEDTGCCDSSGQNAASMLFGIALFGLVLGRRRRR